MDGRDPQFYFRILQNLWLHIVLTWNQAELGGFLQGSLLDCETQSHADRNRGKYFCRSMLVFHCWPLWEGCRSGGLYPCPVWKSAVCCKYASCSWLEECWGSFAALVVSNNPCRFVLAFWKLKNICFQLVFLLKWNESYGLLSPKLVFFCMH